MSIHRRCILSTLLRGFSICFVSYWVENNALKCAEVYVVRRLVCLSRAGEQGPFNGQEIAKELLVYGLNADK